MKFGACIGTNVENMRYAKSLGYDYVEVHCQEIANKPIEHIEAMKAVGMPILAANCFIGMRVIGRERDDAAITEYFGRLFDRAAYLGIKYLVFGSSQARRIVDDEPMSVPEARAQIVDFLKNLVVPFSEKYGIVIAIEPLRPQECNVINTVADGVEIARAVDSPYVRVLADVAHMYTQGESLESLASLGEWLVHAHTSNPAPDPALGEWLVHAHTSNPAPDPALGKKRIYPTAADEFDQRSFIEPLKRAGVEQCSIEADVIDFKTDAKNAYEVLKELR